MHIAISISLGMLLMALNGCGNRENAHAVSSVQKSCAYLWSKQGDDGGWHSETHGILRSGESLTPFILDALLKVPLSVYTPPHENIDRAMEFIRRNVRAKLQSDSVPQIMDYPNYTAAYALKMLARSLQPEDSLLVSALTQYLLLQQFTEHRGIDSLHPAYGGWGFGEVGLKPGRVGHVDISHTRRVLEGLRLTLPSTHACFLKAQDYLGRVQNVRNGNDTIGGAYLDGGFFTSLVIPETNKSLPVPDVPDRWYSYATATCDGLLALHAAGVNHADPRYAQAVKWLTTHTELSYPEGIPHDDPLQWHLVMKYYHLAVRAETCTVMGCDPKRHQAMTALLVDGQRRNGSFLNLQGALNKENDPLLATAFVVTALAHVSP